MRVVAVGSEGNIGAPLVEYLRSVGHEVYATDIKPGYRSDYVMADINHPVDLLDVFDWHPDVVFLMAAVVSRVTCEQASSLAITTNLAGVNNVIQLTKRADAKLIFFSTSEVYGPNALMDEERTKPQPNNRYGLTKYLGEQLVEYEVRQHGLRAVTVRPFMFYSEKETLGDHRSAMIRFAQNLSIRSSIEVHRGSQRSWMHIDDAVVALERTIYLDQYHVINIGHPEVISTETLARMIQTKLGVSTELIHIVDQPERMTLSKVPELRKQRELLNVDPVIDIVEGVRRVCARFA